MLTDKEKYRYSRHLLLDKVGEVGQEKLKAAKVLVIGAGGLGCPVLQYLTAAGVGTIGIIDFDVVDETNLQRQILFSVDDIGKNKALKAKDKLLQLNPYIKIIAYPEALTTKNALFLFQQYDIIVDGTDNFSTRYLVNDACLITNKPLVYGAIYKYEGQVTVFNFNNGPSYRCLFPEAPKPGSVPNCSEIGVLGILPGLIGTQQANEILKIILQKGKILSGRMLIYDAMSSSTVQLTIKKNQNQINQILKADFDFENYNYDYFCSMKEDSFDEIQHISAMELKSLIQQQEIQLVDVRESWEQPKFKELKSINIPLPSLPHNFYEIEKNKKTVIFCQKGARSIQAIEFLQTKGYKNLINLKGGIVTW